MKMEEGRKKSDETGRKGLYYIAHDSIRSGSASFIIANRMIRMLKWDEKSSSGIRKWFYMATIIG
jgi:hypothetical protein